MNAQDTLTASSEAPSITSDNDPSSAEEQSRFWSKLPQLLRWIGGISLAGSAAAFLMGGWMNAEPLLRYYSFFALTSALSLAGLFCGLRLKEDKGARTFLSLGAAFLPVLFCQLGGLVFAQWMGAPSQFSEYFELFQFDPIGATLLTVTLAVALVLLPLYAFLGFSAMARADAKPLTLVYILSNLSLLLPFRGDLAITIIGLVLLVALISIDLRVFAKRTRLQTWDGRAMRSLLFAPFAILILRNVLLYDVSESMLSLFFSAITAFTFVALPQSFKSIGLKRFFQYFSLLPLFVAWATFIEPFMVSLHSYGINSFTTFIILPYAGIIAYLAKHTADSGRAFRAIAATFAIGGAVLQLSQCNSLLAAGIALTLSIATIIAAYFVREKGLLTIASLGTAISLLFHLNIAIELYQSNLWLSLAGTGVAVIIVASYIERHWQKLIAQGKELRATLGEWN